MVASLTYDLTPIHHFTGIFSKSHYYIINDVMVCHYTVALFFVGVAAIRITTTVCLYCLLVKMAC